VRAFAGRTAMIRYERARSASAEKAMAIVDFDEKQVDAIFEDIDQCHLPGAAVGIAIDGQPVYRKGFGLASMELPVVLSPRMRMRIMSVSKHFTAFAYMLLCEDGRSHIDDRVGKFLPELHPITHDVTMRQLMGHTGGLREAHDICLMFSGVGKRVSSRELLALYRDMSDVNAPPGTRWIYSNGGYLILTAVIERITGGSLEDVLRERIFDPIGMSETMLHRSDTEFLANSASLHAPSSSGGFARSSFLNMEWAGEGGIVSTIDDMLLWLAHMDAPKVGAAATWHSMRTPLRLANGTSTGYSLGLVAGRYRGIDVLSHPGGALGGNAQMLKVPGARLDVVIMVNRHDANAALLVNKILDACLPHLDPTPECDANLVSGSFHSPTTGRVIEFNTLPTVSWAEAGQQIVTIDGMEMPVEPNDEGMLWPSGFFAYNRQAITLINRPNKPPSVILDDFGHIDELSRLQPPESSDTEAIVGKYRSDATRIEASIYNTADGLRLQTDGRFGSAVSNLECLAESVWRVRLRETPYVGGILWFEPTSSGFQYSSYTTRSLRFQRTG
jgi:D-aminopeptidase